MKFEDIFKELKAGKYRSLYLLMGEEPYFIDELSNYIAENALSEAERSFNQTILYGKEANVLDVISLAKRYPMMADKQVVIVREAQLLKNIEKLEGYVSDPLSSTILVLCHKYKTYDKRKALSKQFAKNGVVFTSDKIRDYQIQDWLMRYAGSVGLKINLTTAKLIGDHLGTDLSKITNAFSKLQLVLPKGAEVTPDVVQKNIGISKDYNVFELQTAIGKKDVYKVNQIIHYFSKNPKEHPLVVLISTLYNFFSKILLYHVLTDKADQKVASELKVHPFFVKEYKHASKLYPVRKAVRVISYLKEYDLKSKGIDNVSVQDSELMRELMFKILH